MSHAQQGEVQPILEAELIVACWHGLLGYLVGPPTVFVDFTVSGLLEAVGTLGARTAPTPAV
jgi:hypothetical protein